jgi:hypothetical protein
MDPLTLYGAFAVTAMVVFYALESRSPFFVLAFAAACLASSVYGFLQGAWPFGVVELIWSGVALRRWWHRRAQPRPLVHSHEESGPAGRRVSHQDRLRQKAFD